MVIKIGHLGVGRSTRHVFELNVVRVEVLNDSDVVAGLLRHHTVLSVAHQRVLLICLPIWIHLGFVVTSGSCFLGAEVVCIGAGSVAFVYGRGVLIFMVAHGLKLLILGVVNAIIERFKTYSSACKLLLLLILSFVAIVSSCSVHLKRLTAMRWR